MEISLKEFIDLLIKKIWLILLCFLIASAGAFAITKLFIKPRYASSISFLISYEGGGTGGSSSANSDLTYSMNVMNNCVELLSQNDFYNDLSSFLQANDIDITAENVKKATKYNIIPKTTVLSITITTTNAQTSYDIAQAMGQNVSQYIEDKYPQAGSGSIKANRISTPELKEEPVYPNTILNTFIGAIAGLGVGVILVLLIARFDIRIKSEEDLTERYSIPVLGIIPKFDSVKEVK